MPCNAPLQNKEFLVLLKVPFNVCTPTLPPTAGPEVMDNAQINGYDHKYLNEYEELPLRTTIIPMKASIVNICVSLSERIFHDFKQMYFIIFGPAEQDQQSLFLRHCLCYFLWFQISHPAFYYCEGFLKRSSVKYRALII